MNTFDISSSALTFQRLRMDVIAQNVANAETTRAEEGTPYRRKLVVAQELKSNIPFSKYLSDSKKGIIGQGVKAVSIQEDPSDLKLVYDPSHPDANDDGYVEMPNVDILEEMVDMISATRSYEANVTALNASKSLAMKALEIGR